MKSVEKSKESLGYVNILGNVMSAIVRLLRSVHNDLRSSLSRVSLVLPMVLSILSALSTLFTLIIQGHRLHDGLDKDASALIRMTNKDIAQSVSHIVDHDAQAQAIQSIKNQREIARQRVFRVGGNGLLFMVYALLSALLIAFPGALPFLLTSIAISQIVSAVRIGYAMYEKSHAERKFHEVFASMGTFPSIDDSPLGKKRFHDMLQDAVTNKIVMAVLNALTTGVVLSGVFFPPIAIAMNAMALILLGTTVSVSMHYHTQKEQAADKIRQAYIAGYQSHDNAKSASQKMGTITYQVKPAYKHEVATNLSKSNKEDNGIRKRIHDENKGQVRQKEPASIKNTSAHVNKKY